MAVKAQAETLLAHLELQGLGLETGHLLGAELLAVADAVFGIWGQPHNSYSTIIACETTYQNCTQWPK